MEAAGAADGGGPPRRSRVVPAVLVVAAVVAVAVGVVALRGGGDGGSDGVVLLPAAEVGPDPWADDLDLLPAAERGAAAGSGDGAAPAEAADVEGVEDLDEPVALAGRRVRGNATALYTGARDEAPCDVEALTELLTGDDADEALADAWFAALDLHVEDGGRDGYLDDLTALRLRLDTRVTAHGRTGGDGDGGARAYQAVLQAGTAVLVDDRGIPRARCAGATPLAEVDPGAEGDVDPDAEPANPDEAWDGFDPAAVVVVEPGTTTEGFEVAGGAAGPFVRPLGSDGDRDRAVFTPDGPEECVQDCRALEISVATGAGTPANISWEGVGAPGSQTETTLSWDEAEPGTYRYSVFHTWELYSVVEPGDPTVGAMYDDPEHDDEVFSVEMPPVGGTPTELPRVLECIPGEVTVTITVDGAEAESFTEDLPCDGRELVYTLE